MMFWRGTRNVTLFELLSAFNQLSINDFSMAWRNLAIIILSVLAPLELADVSIAEMSAYILLRELFYIRPHWKAK